MVWLWFHVELINTSLAITVLFDVLKSDASNNTKIELVKDFDLVLDLGFTKMLEENNNVDKKTK